MKEILARLKYNSRKFAAVPAETRSRTLQIFADSINRHSGPLLSANARDVAAIAPGISTSLVHRIKLTEEKLVAVADGIRQLANEPDPIGKLLHETTLDDGLVLSKVSVPLGTVGVIFEARPDVLPQLVALCLRTGNGIVLKGGRETNETNREWMRLLDSVFSSVNDLPLPIVVYLEGREAVQELLQATESLDLIIPRGSRELVVEVMQQSKVPVLGHADGVCHLYVDGSANLDSALAIILDSKLQYPAACNSIETLLVASSIAEELIVRLGTVSANEGLKLRGCSKTILINSQVDPVMSNEWATEYGCPTLAIKIVEDLDEAIEHINTFGSHHTDAIVATEQAAQVRFQQQVESSSVMVNCSTRFADGYRYGFGAEVGISTGKIHARGPVGLDGLMTYQYRLMGSGQVVSEYVGDKAKRFRHATYRAE